MHKNDMIYIIKQEGLYQNKVNSSLVSTCNCKMDYSHALRTVNKHRNLVDLEKRAW